MIREMRKISNHHAEKNFTEITECAFCCDYPVLHQCPAHSGLDEKGRGPEYIGIFPFQGHDREHGAEHPNKFADCGKETTTIGAAGGGCDQLLFPGSGVER